MRMKKNCSHQFHNSEKTNTTLAPSLNDDEKYIYKISNLKEKDKKSLQGYCFLDHDLRKWLSHPPDSMRVFLAKHNLTQINDYDFLLGYI